MAEVRAAVAEGRFARLRRAVLETYAPAEAGAATAPGAELSAQEGDA